MAADQETYQVHLTPRGWEDGPGRMGFTAWSGTVPEGSVGYIALRQEQSSGFSSPEYWVDDPVITNPQGWAVLYAQFGPCTAAEKWGKR